MKKESLLPSKAGATDGERQAPDIASTSKKKTPADSINSPTPFYPPVDFHSEFKKAKCIRFEWQDVKLSNEYDEQDGRRRIPFVLIRLPKGVELKIYGSHLSSETDWEASHLVEKNRKVGLEFIRPALNTVPPNIDFLFRQIADDSGGYTFHPLGLLCNKNSDLQGPLLNTSLQKARRDPNWIEIYRYVSAIKSGPEAILARPSMFNSLWRILLPAIRKNELKTFLSVMKSLEAPMTTKLEKYSRALFFAREAHGRIPTAKQIQQALNSAEPRTFREDVKELSQVIRSLKEFRLYWIIGGKNEESKVNDIGRGKQSQ